MARWPGTTARPNRSPPPLGMRVLANWWPNGVTSTIFPSPPLTVRTSPLGAMTRPSGLFSAPPRDTVKPAPALKLRNTASGMAAIRLVIVSATYSVPFGARPSPVGPRTRAEEFSASGKPDPIVARNQMNGSPKRGILMTSRNTVPPKTVWPPPATVPFSTLVTNSTAWLPRSRVAMSHGPLMPLPQKVSRTWPNGSSTIRQPGPETFPPLVGSEPTMTQPLRSEASAVVRPTPPGQPGRFLLILANCDTWPPGETWTIVVPVPCTFALLLKLLISTSPRCRKPTLRGTTATPYGLTSPLAGTVDAIVLTWCSGPMKDPKPCAPALPAVPASRPTVAVTTAASPAAYRLVGFIAIPLPFDGPCLYPSARCRERIGSEAWLKPVPRLSRKGTRPHRARRSLPILIDVPMNLRDSRVHWPPP